MRKKLMIAVACALLSAPAFSQNNMQDRVDNWTGGGDQMTKGRPGGIKDGETPSKEPGVPAGDTAWALIAGLGLAYGAFVLIRKRKEA